MGEAQRRNAVTHRIARVEPNPEALSLRIHWKDGKVTTKAMRGDITRRAILAALADRALFRRVRVLDGGYAIGWPGTEIAFAADSLWYAAHPRELPFPDAVMTAADFKHWMGSQGLSLSAAAELLGLSRRTVAYYSGGTRVIPRVVFLACMALATARRRAPAAA